MTTFLHGRVPASNLVDDEVLKRLNLAGMGFQAEGGMKFSVGQLPLSNDPTGGQSGGLLSYYKRGAIMHDSNRCVFATRNSSEEVNVLQACHRTRLCL